MAKMIRCVEGHVFDAGKGQCPDCGWRVPHEGLAERLARSVPSRENIRRAIVAQARQLRAAVDNLAAVDAKPEATWIPAAPRKTPTDSLADTILLLIRSRTAWVLVLVAVFIAVVIGYV